MYQLSNDFSNRHFSVNVVGCGGTGGFVAEALCRLLPDEASLVLIDHDRVEERNLTRQCFLTEDLGRFKSETLAHRLAQSFDRPIGYSTFPVAMTELSLPGLVIGCVDNGLARRDIARKLKESLNHGYSSILRWWIDAGNGDNYGQVLIGNTDVASDCWMKEDIYHGLPLPTIQKPELLIQAPRVTRDCSAIAEDQGPTINLTMAAIVVEVARRLIAGTCPWVQLYLDMEAGTLVPVLATPKTVKHLSKKKGGEA